MRLAINGYGRIGRCVLRAASQRQDCRALDFVAINEPAPADAVAYLSRYDSTHGRFPGEVSLANHQLIVETNLNCYRINLLNHDSGSQVDWSAQGVDILLDCSGEYGTLALAEQHVKAGAGRVLLSYPGEADIPAIVLGVNQGEIAPEQRVISAASCTSNALVPVLKIIQDSFGIERGVVTTIHASMHDQPVIDAYHSDDLRKNRAASQSIIPVATALASGVARVLPILDNKLIAHAMRVPVNNVSALNVTLELCQSVTASAVNSQLSAAQCGELKGILGFTTETLASCDFIGDTRSAIVDGLQTDVVGSRTVNLLIWFDNEWAFANRMLDIALIMAEQMQPASMRA